MNVRNLILFCLLWTFAYCQSSDDDPVGTDCSTRKTHTPGTCQHMDDCPSVKRGEIPSRDITYCNRRQGLVCCPNRDQELEPPQDLSIPGQRISDRKCKEYRSITQKEFYMGSLILNQKGKVVIQDKCQHKSIGLIVGGTDAYPSEFPHQALLGYKPRDNKDTIWVCGGSLVSADHVLTAAHCMNHRETGPVKFVKLGMRRRLQEDDRVQMFNVDTLHPHPQYNRKTNLNDIALIKIKGKVNFNEHLYPICLPTTQPENSDVLLTGFGKTGRDHEQAENLMKVVLNKFTYDECKQLYRNREIDRKSMLCYGSRKESKDSCRGDSGGPIQISNNNDVRCTYKQIGIVSFGADNCGTVGFPGIYVNVFNYINWIEGIVWKDEV
ncbi:venom protease-like [Chironomus tepperi]|uniref:venom protease-like n=1 Tax=Chironomus tepperi TaxID=113505 RepID=UPI00391F7655